MCKGDAIQVVIKRSSFCQVAKDVNQHLLKLGAVSLLPCCLGDDKHGDLLSHFQEWSRHLLARFSSPSATSAASSAMPDSLEVFKPPAWVPLFYPFSPADSHTRFATGWRGNVCLAVGGLS